MGLIARLLDRLLDLVLAGLAIGLPICLILVSADFVAMIFTSWRRFPTMVIFGVSFLLGVAVAFWTFGHPNGRWTPTST